jgi:hypothetical protein
MRAMPRFCRHNRFVERCPICRDTVPGLASDATPRSRARARTTEQLEPAAGRAGAGARRAKASSRHRTGLHVSHERRAQDDGYRSPLAPGLRASEDAERLAQEIAFAQGRRLTLQTAPPGLYREIREQRDREQALWMCFLSAYLCPLGDAGAASSNLGDAGAERLDPFIGIRRALQADWRAGELPDLSETPLGPRTSHDPARGDATLRAHLLWAQRAGSQAAAFLGDSAWTPARRFERLFERLTFPGLARMGRYELLVTLGCLGLCELRAETLCFVNAIGPAQGDLATTAAKRVFGIGEQVHLEHRAKRLAEAAAVPLEALDLALANWGAGERATLGVPVDALDEQTLERTREALAL